MPEDGGEESATWYLIQVASRAMLPAWMKSRKQGPDSVEELVETGQYYEAEVVEGVEDAPLGR